jgi:predicted dinucleotide-binding enzyme
MKLRIHGSAAARTPRRGCLSFGGLLALALLLIPVTAPTQAAAPEKPLKVGIIGTGHIGGALATLWAKAGYELMLSSRHPAELKSLAESLGPKVRVGTPRAAATFGDAVLISVPYAALPQLGKDLAHELSGKIVLDTGNPYPQRDGDMALAARQKGTGVASAEFLPGVRLVRAFNAITYKNLADQAHHAGELYAIPLAGDDAKALTLAQRMVRDAGFEPVVVGGLDKAKLFDVGTPVYVKLLTAPQLRTQLGLAAPAASAH